MAKPFTENVDYVYQWLNDTNRISENLGDPVNVYATDGDYTVHNAAYPSYLINQSAYTHDAQEQNAVVLSLNDLNARKVQRTGDIITGNLRINQNLIIDLDLLVQGGDISSSASSFNLLNTPTSIVAFSSATTVGIGSGTGTTTINHDLSVNGGDLLTSQATFNLLNATATTINAFGAATAITIGAATGLTTINHSVLIKGGATQTFVIDDGTFTKFSVDSTNGDTSIAGTLGVTGNATLTSDLAVNGGDITTSATTFNLLNATATTVNAFGGASAINMGAVGSATTLAGDLAVNGGDLTTTVTTFNLLNATATTVNAFGAATAITIGAPSGSLTTIRTATTIESASALALQVFNTNTKFSVSGANGNTMVGGTLGVSGATTLSNTLGVTGNTVLTGDLAVNGGDITTSSATFNLAVATATTVAAFSAGTSISIGAATGTTTINNANTVITGDLAVNGGDITTSAISFNLLNSGSLATVNAFTSATAISIGAATGTTTINNSLTIAGGSGQYFYITDGASTKFSVDTATGNATVIGDFSVVGNTACIGGASWSGDIAVNGGDITTTAPTFNVANSGANAVHIGGLALTLSLGNITTFGQTANLFTSSTGTSTYNLGTGATGDSETKTINLGTNGVANSTTNVNLGSVNGGLLDIRSPSIKFASKTTNGILYTSGGVGTVDVLTTATANKVLLSGSSAAPIWSTSTFPSAVATNSLLFAKTADTVEAMQFISSDSTIAFDYSTNGKVDVKSTGNVPSTINVSGDLNIGSNKSGSYSQSGGTTITVNIVGHGLVTSAWVYLDFTSGAAVDGAYQVTYVDADNFTVQGTAQTTSGNVTAQLGGTGSFSKVLAVGTSPVSTTSMLIKAYDLTQITKLLEVQSSTGATKLLIEPSGKTTINGDLHVQGNIVNTGSSGAVVTQGIVEDPVTTTSTTETVIMSLAAATYRSIEFQIQAVEGTKFWTSKILAIHDGTNVNWTEYGMAGIGASPITGYALDISTGNILLKVTSASAASTTYKVVATAILA